MIRIFRLAEQATAEADRRPHRFEGIGVQLLRHQPDQRARGAVAVVDIVAADRDAAFARSRDPADDADQRGLAGAVRPQQRKNLAALDLQIDVVQRLETGAIGLGKI
jgi:hypothetical protein